MGTVLAAAVIGRARIACSARTDRPGMQRIGRSDAGRKTRADRRQDLHRQRNQDDWKKISQATAHDPTFSIAPT